MGKISQKTLLVMIIAVLAALLVVLAVALALTMKAKTAQAGATGQGENVSASAENASTDAKTKPDNPKAAGKDSMAAKLKQAAKQYAEVLDNIDKYKFEESWSDSGEIKYTYSLGDINGDKIPDLSVDKQYSGNEGSLSATRFFSSDGTDKPVVAPEKSLQGGVASGGGYRGGVSFTKDGNGVVEWYFYSGSGEGESTLYRLQDNQLVEAQKQSFSMGDKNSSSLNVETYDAKPISANNRAYLYFLEHGDLDTLAAEQAKDWDAPEPTVPDDPGKDKPGKDKTAKPGKDKSPDKLKKALATAKAQGKQAFIGTVRIMTHDEVLAFQGVPEPNPINASDKGIFALLTFDSPQDVQGTSGGDGDSMTLTVAGLYLGGGDYHNDSNLSQWQPLNGKRAVVVGTQQDFGYPSDARVPLGLPAGGSLVAAEG